MKQVKSVAYYLLHNMADVTYPRVLKAYLKYPDASLYELQHGVGSKASISYRTRHVPEIEKGYGYSPKYTPEYIPEYIPREELKIFCYRDTLTGDKYAYKGINLYFAEKSEKGFFSDVREHFAEQFERYFGNMDYECSDQSECSAEDMDHEPDEITERDFIFDIGNLKSAQLQYWGHWQKNHFVSLNIFDEFDIGKLERILMRR
jgi:hypothetical protein